MDKPIRYDVTDTHTGKIVASFKSGTRASSYIDRHDMAYGAYRYARRAVWG